MAHLHPYPTPRDTAAGSDSFQGIMTSMQLSQSAAPPTTGAPTPPTQTPPASAPAPAVLASDPYARHPLPSHATTTTTHMLPPPSQSQPSSSSQQQQQQQQQQPQQQQSFGMGPQSQSTYSRSLGDANQRGHDAPQIYSAIYSGIDVYEMEVDKIAVMRRRADNWLNATQILKVAGVDKGKRTKILEKEIQTGGHEKVQGGYGKYQGTWICFDRGVEVCRQYGVEDKLMPLLTYDVGPDGTVSSRTDLNTPTKEQAMAAQRKRLYNQSQENRPNGVSGTFFKNISPMASQAVAAISKARFDSPAPRNRTGPLGRAPSFTRQSSNPSQDEFLPAGSQQSFASEYGGHADSTAFPSQGNDNNTNNGPTGMLDEPPRKKQRVAHNHHNHHHHHHHPGDSFGYGPALDVHGSAAYPPGSPTEPNESFLYAHSSHPSTAGGGGGGGGGPFSVLPPLPYEPDEESERKRSSILNLFVDPDTSVPEMPAHMTPHELAMPIDQTLHNVLHWASSLSRVPLLRQLVACGANPFRVNRHGETPLIRAAIVTNCYETGSFPDILDILGGTMEIPDNKGRTVLHHIAISSGITGRGVVSRYYLESLLEWVVRQGSAPSSQVTNGPGSSQPQAQAPKMGIARFMSEIVNAQDHAGDTALNIAARIGNRSIISQLLEVGADPNIANRSGLKPITFGVGAEAEDEGLPAETNGAPTGSQKPKESNEENMDAIAMLLRETAVTFNNEGRQKQTSIDVAHNQIQTKTAELNDIRRGIGAVRDVLNKQQLNRQKAANLTHSLDEMTQQQQRQSSAAPAPAGSDGPNSAWEPEVTALLAAHDDGATPAQGVAAVLPATRVLRAKINALSTRSGITDRMVQSMRMRSRDMEDKYRRILSLCTGVPEGEIDPVVDSLLKAMDNDAESFEGNRVRRFLGDIERLAN